MFVMKKRKNIVYIITVLVRNENNEQQDKSFNFF